MTRVFQPEAFQTDSGSAPVNTVAPAVTGTAEQTFTLTTDNGTWTGDTSSGYTYQWQRDFYADSSFAEIPGATDQTYVQTIADVDCDIRCVVTATGTGGFTAQASNTVGPVAVCPPDETATLGPALCLAADRLVFAVNTSDRAVCAVVASDSRLGRVLISDL